MPKIIGFFGSCPEDICMYAAYALQNAGKRVCVVDNSQDGILFGCIPAPDGQMEAVTFHNVDFMRWEPVVEWQELDYEFLLVQLGSTPQQLCLALCSVRILVTDCERGHLDYYHQLMQQAGMPTAVLLRSFCQGKSTVEKRKEYFAYGNRFIERWLLLPFDQADEAYRIEMQYGILDQFVHISAGMERVLVKLLQMLEIRGRARMVQAVRNAKQGKTAGLIYHSETNTESRTETKTESRTETRIKPVQQEWCIFGNSGFKGTYRKRNRLGGYRKVQGICRKEESVENCILE